ncbi:hypothetical protein AURDEDRAFT_130160 [Auricularia subglabra TFB-10046 SS5]|uniref:Uncharacterized protein n=1 Tax=Auricularia subglabra (strain TFB-10046 / SS5) TaxID=717982 RepID=J0WSP0_AURST|nr:hypothetical protein AURDEDRAFT_130160 [Auricularia subglabra TFB-10046 SS5]
MNLDHETPRKYPSRGSQLEPDVVFTPNSRPHPSGPGKELLAVVPEGESLDMAFLTRCPRDERESPNHPMCITHELRAEIRYWTPGNNERVARFSQPIEFTSCCCLLESMTLPCYSPHDSSSEESHRAVGAPGGPSIDRALAQCACEMSTERLLQIHGREAFEAPAPVTVIETEQERPKAVYVPASGSQPEPESGE